MTAAQQGDCLELDELYWFVERKPRIETRENVYVTINRGFRRSL